MLGGRASITAAGLRWADLGGRPNVFSGMPHTLYLPVNGGPVEIEALTESKAFLELLVKVDENWRDSTPALRRFGYQAR